MARPREFEEEETLKKIRDVFWQYGYDGVSYPALMKATGLHKASLYSTFGDKHALYIHALKTYDQQEITGAVQMLCEEDNTTGAARIVRLLNAVIDAVAIHGDRRGCLLCNAIAERAPHNDEVRDWAKDGTERMRRSFEAALKANPTTKNLSASGLRKRSSTITALYFGMRIMAKSGVPVSMMRNARDGALPLLET